MDREQGKLDDRATRGMTHAAASARYRTWIAPAIALALVASGCAAMRGEPVTGAPDGTTVVKLTGFRPASTPPDPRLASPTAVELEGSLRRIVVSYTKFGVWYRTDPQPLLSEQEIRDYAQILARELPALSDRQRLRFKFTDRFLGKGYNVEFDVYREGTFLVYWFNALASSATDRGPMGATIGFRAILEPSAGQDVANRDTYAYVKDPLLGEESALAADREAKQQQFEQARKNGDFEPDEETRLTAMMARPQPIASAWRSYWERRHTLKTALQQGLTDRAAYDAQVERLNAEMEKKEPLLGEESALAADREAKQQQFEQARKNGDFEPDEENRLTAMMARPRPVASAWRSYWDRRHTLKVALQQGLMGRAAYNAQVQRLNADLEKPEK